MSKKRIRSRLENLFSSLAGDEPVTANQAQDGEGTLPGGALPSAPEKPGRKSAHLSGWSWEINAHFNYTSCGVEVSDALQINPLSFVGKSILSYALSAESRRVLESAFTQKHFPVEVGVYFEPQPGRYIPARLHILSQMEENRTITGWRGYVQRLPENGQASNQNGPAAIVEGNKPSKGKSRSARNEPKTLPLSRRAAEKIDTQPLAISPPAEGLEPSDEAVPYTALPELPERPRVGIAYQNGGTRQSNEVWTALGKQVLEKGEFSQVNAGDENPATMAMPMQMQGVGDLLLEIVDDNAAREWSEDDRLMVQEVAAQLALALDNAQLYLSVQQELAERIRAEQAILRRNKDLATLNRIGQELGRLTTRAQVFDLLYQMVGEMLDNSNTIICTYSVDQNLLTFPVYRENGKPVDMPSRLPANGVAEYVIRSHAALLVREGVAGELFRLGITLPDRVPLSLLAIPILAGDQALGALILQDFTREQAYDSIHIELLSTAAAQAATALENADLFDQMQQALNAIENRERYQANVALAAAVLTEFGTKSMPDVLNYLAQATECSRIYFARLIEDERGIYWSAVSDWISPAVAYLFDKTRVAQMPVSAFPNWVRNLREDGIVINRPSSGESTPELEFINSQHIRSNLLLAIPGPNTTPSFLAFDQLGEDRIWQNEEISALRVAADAISNTFVREELLEQLQVSLDETEGLYKASNRLALASDMQEMVTAILSGVRAPEINRAVLLLFEYDNYAKINRISVGANWYSGRGTPPPPVGTEYLRNKYERILQTSGPIFYDDILETQIEKELQDTMLHQNIRALAILPLWSGKRQTGVLMLQSEIKHHFTGRETRTYPPLVDQMAIAVENQRLFEQTQEALSETELLYNTSNRIAQANSARDMLSLVVDSVLPKEADRVQLMLINSDANGELVDLEVVGSYDVKGEYQQLGTRMPVAGMPLIKSLTDEPLIINDINQYPLDVASLRSLEQFHITSGCMVPLRSSGRLIGVLSASSRFPTEFNPEDIRLLRIVGNGIAVALEKQRLLVQAQRRALELQTASEIARDTASTLSLDLLLSRIVNMLSERFGFYHASIFLLDSSGTYAVIRESTGTAGKEMKQRGHKLAVGSRSVVGTVVATGEPFILNDVQQNSLHFPNPLLPETRAEMGIPLKLGATVIGALDLQSKNLNAFTQDEVTVLQILADQIAIAIENARAYELSQKAIADMKEIDRVKSQFLANMSHELRTPLNSIIGFSRVIIKGIDGPVNETQKQDLTAIYNSGQHLLNLINDLLDLSKIEAGKMELAFTDMNLVDMINSAMSTAIGLVKDKPIKLNNRVPESLPLVRADSTRVRQVLINFLSNAAKFTDDGTITIDASLVSGPKGKPEVMVTVTDTGPGIGPEDQIKLFLPFSQVDDSPTRKTGGTGLGLSICRSLIEMHNGRIGLLSSDIGKGSTFYFTLPVAMPDTAPLRQHESPNDTNVVLCIDDDPRVINLYERYLKPSGYQVVALTNPKQALERIKEVKPFAITLDIMMPEKDGWQVLRDLKNSPEAREIPIIVCSILENQEKGFSMGAADYLVKPFLQEDLLNAIGRLNRAGEIRKILLVDDDLDDLRLVKKMLEQDERLNITAIQGGVAGLEAIQEQHPDVVILDLFMPDLNGFGILEAMRSDPVLRNTPVIVLTGADLSSEQHQQLTDVGQGVLTKGYLRDKDLLVLLEEALRKYHPQVQEQEE